MDQSGLSQEERISKLEEKIESLESANTEAENKKEIIDTICYTLVAIVFIIGFFWI